MKFLPNYNCYWTLVENLSTSNLNEILNMEYNFTYFLDYELVGSFENNNIKLENLIKGDYLFSNCKTNIIMETKKIQLEDLDFFKKRRINLLQSNTLLPDYAKFNENSIELFLKLINKNTQWMYYIELSAYERKTEIYSPKVEIIEQILKRISQ